MFASNNEYRNISEVKAAESWRLLLAPF